MIRHTTSGMIAATQSESPMISSIAELEACLGAPGLPAKLKAIDHLDSLAAAWIAMSPLMSAMTAGPTGAVKATLGGGDPGFAAAEDANTMTVARAALDDANAIDAGDGIAFLFLAPGVTETFRVNGRVEKVSATHVGVRVDECFVHCGKALIRSDFWQPQPPAHTDLPGAARLCVLGTTDGTGNVDASPKGDPAGFLMKLDDKTFALPDRLGNRRADGHRNVIAHDRIAMIAFAPGATAAIELTGRARLTRDTTMLSRMTVAGKDPLLATVIAIDRARTYDSQALHNARIWGTDRMEAPRPNPGATLAAHINLSQERNHMPAAERFAVTPEGANQRLAESYKTGLY